MPDKPIKPEMQEIAAADHGIAMTTAYTNILIDNPDTVLARRGMDYRAYDELLRDDQVKSTLQQRRSGLTSKSWTVEPASESATDVACAEFIQEQLEKVGWDTVTDKMLYGIFYGFAVAEAMWEMDGGKVGLQAIKVRERSRFKYNKDGNLYLIHSNHPQGLKMPEQKFWTFNSGANHDDNHYGQGLAHSLYWPVFFKRSDIKFWLIFLEKFGMPTTAIRLPDGQVSEPKQIAKAKQALAAIQADSGVVIPESMTIELIEAARSGSADYDGMCERMDKAISKVVLSQTMTTDDGSSQSQANVHKTVSQEVIDADADLIAETFQATIGTWLTEWNFPGATPPVIKRDTEPEEDLNIRAERDGKIHALGFDPTEDYIEETYGVGWEKRETPEVEPGLLATGKGDMPAEFAEVSRLLLKRADHREDQQAIADAARYLSTKYNNLLGGRVEQILAYLDDSDDLDTFQKHMTEAMAQAAPESSVEAIQKATVFGRLMGMFRGQPD